MNIIFRRAIGNLLQSIKLRNLASHSIRAAADVSRVSQSIPLNNLSEDEFVKKFSQENPKLNLRNVGEFYRNISGCGIGPAAAMKMLVDEPSILSMPGNVLEKNLLGWLSLQLGDELCSILMAHPFLLRISQKDLSARYTRIVSVFAQRKVGKLILLNPAVVTEDWRMLLKKIEYLKDKFGLTLSEIINASALNYPMKHIQERMEFLHKAGKYTIPKPKTPPANKPNNPNLREILGLSAKLFAINIAGLTAFEFEVFQQLRDDEEMDEYSDESDHEN